MSYYANGGGTLVFTAETDLKTVIETLCEAFTEAYECPISPVKKDEKENEKSVEIEVHLDGKYYEDQIYDVIKKVEPDLISGEISFIGEDDSVWCIRCSNGTICEVPGYTIFLSNDAKKLLQKVVTTYKANSETEAFLIDEIRNEVESM